jgi:hypothetical protein
MIDDSAPLNYKVAYAHGEMNPKKRHTMEDVHRVLPTLEDLPLYSYFGVYDGKFCLINHATNFLAPTTNLSVISRSRGKANS